MRRLPNDGQETLEIVCTPMLVRIERRLARILGVDEVTDRSRFVGPMSTEVLCRYILHAVFTSFMKGDECGMLSVLLDASPYDDTTREKDIRK